MFTLYAKTIISLAAELARLTRDRGAVVAQAGCVTRLESGAVQAIAAIAVVEALNADAGRGLAGVTDRVRVRRAAPTWAFPITHASYPVIAATYASPVAMRSVQTLHAPVERLAAPRRRWYAVHRIDVAPAGSAIQRFIAEIDAVAEVTVAVGRHLA